jgi:hypothetical protein
MNKVVGKVVDESFSVDEQGNTLSSRLKVARAALEMTQEGFARTSGIPLPSLRDYELCKRILGGRAVASMIRVGINANWLLVGEGPMWLADITPTVAGALDLARLRLALQSAEEGLAEAGRVMPPDRKAELVIAIYDLCEEPSASKEKMLKLVKFAA